MAMAMAMARGQSVACRMERFQLPPRPLQGLPALITIARPPALQQLQGKHRLGLLPLTTKIFTGPEDKDLQPSESVSQELDVKSPSELFVRWEIPWDGKTVLITITAFGMSFLFTGLAVAILLARLGLKQRQSLDMDEQSLQIFINQILQTFVGISVIKACTKSYSPLPEELFSYALYNLDQIGGTPSVPAVDGSYGE